jgi:S1-C subfamily serine protease
MDDTNYAVGANADAPDPIPEATPEPQVAPVPGTVSEPPMPPVAPPPASDEDDRNPVPIAARPNEPGRSLVTTGCVVVIISLIISSLAGGAAGYGAARFSGGSTVSGGGEVRVVGTTTDEPVAAAAAAALPSVVNIDVRSTPATPTTGADGLPQGHPSVPQGGTGSGVAFQASTDGGTYILTNNHVVENADSITVTPADGARLRATIVGRDPETDIAVVKVDTKLPTIDLGDSEKLVVGQMVVAIGSPFGLQHSVSSGIVSALHRALPGSSGAGATQTYPLVDVIQTDAAINPGNSGGALVDRRGLLVGINSAIYSDTGQNAGIGFAIPIATARRIASELIAGGAAKHPFLGVEGMTVDEALAKERKLPVTEGAIIEKVLPGTGAEKAGLQKGDIVVALGGEPIRTMDDLILRVRRTKVGDRVKLDILRDGKKTTLEMVVGDKPTNLK